MVRGKRIKPVELGVSGGDKILSKCKSFVKSEGVDIKNGDVVAIVTDHDFRYDEESIARLHSECEKNGFQLFLSNASFEVWLLMHYKALSKPYSQEELEAELSEAIDHRYVKSEGILLDQDSLEVALGNCRKNGLGADNPEECLRRNPSTMVHLLVKDLINGGDRLRRG